MRDVEHREGDTGRVPVDGDAHVTHTSIISGTATGCPIAPHTGCRHAGAAGRVQRLSVTTMNSTGNGKSGLRRRRRSRLATEARRHRNQSRQARCQHPCSAVALGQSHRIFPILPAEFIEKQTIEPSARTKDLTSIAVASDYLIEDMDRDRESSTCPYETNYDKGHV